MKPPIVKTLRIRKLYRPVIGWRWWLQQGEWRDSTGAVFYGTGRGRRTFKVDWEESYPTRDEAVARRRRLGHHNGARHENR